MTSVETVPVLDPALTVSAESCLIKITRKHTDANRFTTAFEPLRMSARWAWRALVGITHGMAIIRSVVDKPRLDRQPHFPGHESSKRDRFTRFRSATRPVMVRFTTATKSELRELNPDLILTQETLRCLCGQLQTVERAAHVRN